MNILLSCFISNHVYVTFLLIPWIWNMSIYVLTYLKSDTNFLCTEGMCMLYLFFFYLILELNAFFVVLLPCKSVDWSTFLMKLQKMHWILIIGHERVLSIVICLALVWLPFFFYRSLNISKQEMKVVPRNWSIHDSMRGNGNASLWVTELRFL